MGQCSQGEAARFVQETEQVSKAGAMGAAVLSHSVSPHHEKSPFTSPTENLSCASQMQMHAPLLMVYQNLINCGGWETVKET